MNNWLSVVLGAGGTGFVIAVFQGVAQLRQTAASKAGKLLTDLEKARDDAGDREREARDEASYYLDLADYWREWAGTLEFEARRSGVTIPDRKPLPQRPAPRIQET